MKYQDLEDKIADLLKDRLKKLGDDVADKYKDLAEKLAYQARDVIEGAILGDDVEEEKRFLEASIQNLVSATQALTTREVKDIMKEAAGIVLQAALKAAVAALA